MTKLEQFIDDVLIKVMSIDTFIMYENGNLIEIFESFSDNETIEDNEYQIENEKIKSAINLLDQESKKITITKRVVKAYNNYVKYLKSVYTR